MSTGFKYHLSCLLLLSCACMRAQSDQPNVAVITIIGGEPVPVNTINDYASSNTNPYAESLSAPPVQGQFNEPRTIDPTLENGFHMRFELETTAYQEPSNVVNDERLENVLTGLKPPYSKQTGSMSNTSSGGATMTKSNKHSLNMQERMFNAKKKFKAWFPHRKKKYHPHLCARF